MKKDFNTNADAPQPSQNDQDLMWAINVLDEGGSMQNRRPQLLTIANWFHLAELRHSSTPDDWEFIVAEDRVGDFSFRDRDEECKQVFGFDDTPAGRDAVHRIIGWLGDCYPVWKLGEDGKYSETDLGPSPHAIDLTNPMERQNVIHEVLINNKFIRRAPKKEAGANDFDVPF